jgi:hypothetical protein
VRVVDTCVREHPSFPPSLTPHHWTKVSRSKKGKAVSRRTQVCFLSLSGFLGTTATDRATLVSGNLGFFARPFVSCTHSMCRFSTFLRNFSFLLWCHGSKPAITSWHVFHSLSLGTFQIHWRLTCTRRSRSSIPQNRLIYKCPGTLLETIP